MIRVLAFIRALLILFRVIKAAETASSVVEDLTPVAAPVESEAMEKASGPHR